RHEGGAVPGDDPDGRCRHDRRGRRFDRVRRPGRHLPRWAPLGGCRPGTGRPRTGRHRAPCGGRDGQPWLAAARGGFRRRDEAARRPREQRVRGGAGEDARHDRRGGFDGRGPDPHALDGAVDRRELGAQGLRPARLRARRRGRSRAVVRGADRARGRDADGSRAALPGHRGRDGTAGDGHRLRARGHDLPAARAAALQSRCGELEALAGGQLEEDGIDPANVQNHRIAECRYLGQGYELRVDAPSGAIDEAWAAKVRADFHDIHEREYSRRFEESDIEIPNIRVRGIGLTPALRTPEIEQGDDSPDAALRHEGSAWFRVGGGLQQVPTRYYERAALKAGNRLVGPAIVTQYDSTTVIPPGLAAHVDRFGNI